MNAPRIARLVLVSALVVAAGARAGEIDLRTLQENQPMRVQDADPLETGLLARLLLSSGDIEGEDGLFVQPSVDVSVRDWLELGVTWQGGLVEGDGRAGPVQLSSQVLAFREKGARPTLGFTGEFIAPEDEDGAAGVLGTQLTKSFGEARVHGNVAYQLQDDAGDRLFAGLGSDYSFGDDLLVVGDVAYERFFGRDDGAFTIEAGAATKLGRGLLMHGTVGLNDFEGDTDPRLVVGLMGQL